MFDDFVYDFAVNIEARMTPVKNFLDKVLIDQKVEVRMEVYPTSEWLDHRNDARDHDSRNVPGRRDD